MKKTILTISTFALLAIVIIFGGCKKNDTPTPTPTPPDPNGYVTFFRGNNSDQSTHDSIFVDGNYIGSLTTIFVNCNKNGTASYLHPDCGDNGIIKYGAKPDNSVIHQYLIKYTSPLGNYSFGMGVI